MKRPGLLLLIIIICFSVHSVWGQIQNRSFDLAVAGEPNDNFYFTPPLFWDYMNYAGVHTSFVPASEPFEPVTWQIDFPVDGLRFLVLSTGDIGPNSDFEVAIATASQIIYIPAETKISGYYFFGTCDYLPYNDYGKIELIPIIPDPNEPTNLTNITLASISVLDVGSYQGCKQWQSFSYTITQEQQGYYVLLISVHDVGDTIYKSYLAVDDFSLCGPGILPGDLNWDCTVNMPDFSLFSKEWLVCYPLDQNGCPDPNYIDPNSLCVYADFNKNQIVDPNDFDIFSENWLLSAD